MCYLTPTLQAVQQAIPNGCTAKMLPPSERLTIGLHALAGTQTITGLADDFGVSRKFVYQQADIAQAALDEAFSPSDTRADDQVLFYVPVTKAWIAQVALSLILICHSSYRGVIEFCRDVLDFDLSLGTVHNIVQRVIAQASTYNLGQNLQNVSVAGFDEIFQQRQPVLVGADMHSTYCFLLSAEEHRDADTWAVRMLEAQDRGLAPEATIADFAGGIRAGQQLALADVPCRGDVFHAVQELTQIVTSLDNRAYAAITTHDQLEHHKEELRRQGRLDQRSKVQVLSRQCTKAGDAAVQAIALADDLACLTRWLRFDVLAVSGLPYADRCLLFDFVVRELRARQELCPRLGPVCTLLSNHRDDLLGFAAQLDKDLAALATQFQVSLPLVRQVLDLQRLELRLARHWLLEAELRHHLRDRFYALQHAVEQLADRVVRASSVIENINSRLRNYFFLQRHLGSDSLALLQFFLNHRRFLRSEHRDRVGKSPAELLTGQRHPHWLEMLGYSPFSRN